MQASILREGHIAEYYLSYLVNSDPSGLEDAEVKAVDNWLKNILLEHEGISYSDIVYDLSEDPYFGRDEVSGLQAQVVDYKLIRLS